MSVLKAFAAEIGKAILWLLAIALGCLIGAIIAFGTIGVVGAIAWGAERTLRMSDPLMGCLAILGAIVVGRLLSKLVVMLMIRGDDLAGVVAGTFRVPA